MKLILGSSSPRRLELLNQIGIAPDTVQAADIDETPHRKETPRPYCQRMSREKALTFHLEENELVLCADTIVSAGRTILGKPTDAEHAKQMLKLLSGRRHQVLTSVVIRSATQLREKTVTTIVKIKPLNQTDIEQYIATDEWQGKAGGYAIQGIASRLIPAIYGSYSNVVGLPLTETVNMLTYFMPNKTFMS